MPSRLHLPHLLWPASRSAQMTTALKLMQYVTQQWWPTLPRTQASQSTTWAQLCVRCWLAEDTLHPRRGKHLRDPAQDKDNAKLMFCSMTGHEKLQTINQVWLCMWSAFLDYQSKNKNPHIWNWKYATYVLQSKLPGPLGKYIIGSPVQTSSVI